MSEPERPTGPAPNSHQTPARTAAALHYDGEQAPRLVAKGCGEVAEQIIAIARQHGVYLHEDASLAQSLQQLRLNQEIPRKLYIAIARVIAFAYYLQGKTPEGR